MSAAIRHVWMPQKASPASHAVPLLAAYNLGGCGCGCGCGPCAAEEESTGSDPVTDCGDALGLVSCLCAGTITQACMHMFRPMHKHAFIRRVCLYLKGKLSSEGHGFIRRACLYPKGMLLSDGHAFIRGACLYSKGMLLSEGHTFI